MCLQFGKDKTPSGTGRIIPLNPRAMATLSFWASHFPERKSEHYVFPAERYRALTPFLADTFVANLYGSAGQVLVFTGRVASVALAFFLGMRKLKPTVP
jgi:hypothetical protein